MKWSKSFEPGEPLEKSKAVQWRWKRPPGEHWVLPWVSVFFHHGDVEGPETQGCYIVAYLDECLQNINLQNYLWSRNKGNLVLFYSFSSVGTSERHSRYFRGRSTTIMRTEKSNAREKGIMKFSNWKKRKEKKKSLELQNNFLPNR